MQAGIPLEKIVLLNSNKNVVVVAEGTTVEVSAASNWKKPCTTEASTRTKQIKLEAPVTQMALHRTGLLAVATASELSVWDLALTSAEQPTRKQTFKLQASLGLKALLFSVSDRTYSKRMSLNVRKPTDLVAPDKPQQPILVALTNKGMQWFDLNDASFGDPGVLNLQGLECCCFDPNDRSKIYIVLRGPKVELLKFKPARQYQNQRLWRPDELINLKIIDVAVGSNRLFVVGLLKERKYLLYTFGMSIEERSFVLEIQSGEKPQRIRLLHHESGDKGVLVVAAWRPSFIHGYSYHGNKHQLHREFRIGMKDILSIQLKHNEGAASEVAILRPQEYVSHSFEKLKQEEDTERLSTIPVSLEHQLTFGGQRDLSSTRVLRKGTLGLDESNVTLVRSRTSTPARVEPEQHAERELLRNSERYIQESYSQIDRAYQTNPLLLLADLEQAESRVKGLLTKTEEKRQSLKAAIKEVEYQCDKCSFSSKVIDQAANAYIKLCMKEQVVRMSPFAPQVSTTGKPPSFADLLEILDRQIKKRLAKLTQRLRSYRSTYQEELWETPTIVKPLQSASKITVRIPYVQLAAPPATPDTVILYPF